MQFLQSAYFIDNSSFYNFVYYNWSLIKNNVSCIKYSQKNKNLVIKFISVEHRNGRNKNDKY